MTMTTSRILYYLITSSIFLTAYCQTTVSISATTNITYISYNGSYVNDTPDSTLDNPENSTSISLQILLSLTLVLISLTTIFGNVLVIFSVAIFRKLHTIPNMFVVSLATADLIMGLVVIPLGAHQLVAGKWLLGKSACTLWTGIDVLSVTGSICTLCAIALDRYVAINMPFKYSTRMTRKRAKIIIALIWTMSLAIAVLTFIPSLWQNDLPEDQKCMEDPECCEFRANREYTIVSSFVSFYIPSFIMIFSYSIVFKTAIKQRSKIQNNEGVFRRASMPGSSRSLLWSKREYKAVFTMGIIMGTFVMCWLPFFVSNIVQVVCYRCIPMDLFSIFNWIGYSNSCFNPLIYCHSKEFRRAFKRIFQCSLCRNGYQQTARASLSANWSPPNGGRPSMHSNGNGTTTTNGNGNGPTRISFFQSTSSFLTSRFAKTTSKQDRYSTSTTAEKTTNSRNSNKNNYKIADDSNENSNRSYGRFYRDSTDPKSTSSEEEERHDEELQKA